VPQKPLSLAARVQKRLRSFVNACHSDRVWIGVLEVRALHARHIAEVNNAETSTRWRRVSRSMNSGRRAERINDGW
jgi:hypothetical protein